MQPAVSSIASQHRQYDSRHYSGDCHRGYVRAEPETGANHCHMLARWQTTNACNASDLYLAAQFQPTTQLAASLVPPTHGRACRRNAGRRSTSSAFAKNLTDPRRFIERSEFGESGASNLSAFCFKVGGLVTANNLSPSATAALYLSTQPGEDCGECPGVIGHRKCSRRTKPQQNTAIRLSTRATRRRQVRRSMACQRRRATQTNSSFAVLNNSANAGVGFP